MAKGNIYAGIDIGTSKITTIIVTEDEETRKLRVVGVATEESRGIKKSQVVDIEEAVAAITRSVEAAERMAGFSISEAYISISGTQIDSQNSKGVVAIANSGDEIIEDDVARVIEAARAVSLPSSKEILHVIPRDFSVDSQAGIKDPLSMTGIRLEVDAHIVTGSTPAMRNLAKCVSEIGINVSGLVFSGLAAAESALTETEKELGVCLIDIGGGSTSVTVYVEGALTSSYVIPIGAKHITNDLAVGLRVSLDQAERIKLALSNLTREKLLRDASENSDILDPKKLNLTEDVQKPSYKMMVDGIVRPRLNEIFTLVHDELQKRELVAKTPAGVVLTGGGALTVSAVESANRTLSMPVRIGQFDGEQKTAYKLSGLIDDVRSPIFAVTQGLIIYAVQQISVAGGSALKLPKFGSLVERFSGKGMAGKAVDFIKSFLP